MNDNNSKDKTSLGYKIGYGLGIIGVCCVAAIVIALTIKLIALLLF